jgi:hypothetical protein
MSMTVHIALKGITDSSLLLEALRDMGIKTESTAADTRQKGEVVTFASLRGQRVAFARDKNGGIRMVGEKNSPVMRDESLQNTIRQHYSLAAVKRKVAEMNYTVSQVEIMEDGSIRLVARNWR